jgi:hypothetical protein
MGRIVRFACVLACSLVLSACGGDDGVAAPQSPLVRGVRPQHCHGGPARGGPIPCRPSPSDFDGSHLPSTACQRDDRANAPTST